MLRFEPVHELFGVQVTGLDLRRPLDDATFASVRDAFERHSLLVFPDQPVDDAQQLAFSRRFGPLELTRARAIGEGTEVVVLTNIGPDGALVPPTHHQMLNNRANALWHTDSSFKPVPALASLLSAREVPPRGGETEFASLRVAWRELPEATRNRLEGLVAVHDFSHSRAQIDPAFLKDWEKRQLPPVRQVMVRQSPVTGEKACYVASHVREVEGLEPAEGRRLVDELLAFATRPGVVYSHRWRVGDLVMWDNRCMLHRGRPWDAGRHRRTMVRTTVAGDGPTVPRERVFA